MQDVPATEVRFGDWITEGWRMFAEQWQAWVKMMLVFFLIVSAPVTVLVFVIVVMMPTLSRSQQAAMPLVFMLLIFGVTLVLIFFAMYFTGGLYRAAFKQLRGGRVEVGDLFSAGDRAVSVLGASLLVGLCVMAGMALCIVPAYIAMGLLIFTIPLVVERNLGAVEAMKASYAVTRSNMLMFTLFVFVVGLIAQAGAYACYIGLLATYPLQFTITAVAYRDCLGLAGARSFLPPTQSPPAAYAPPAYGTPQTGQRVCRNCQTQLPPAATFCPMCGAPSTP